MRKGPNRRDRGAKTTIIRRQIKKNHAGHHGGAWKVAFADFTLAMMALFMTLWIVNSVSKADRENIVAALHGQSIFNGGGMAPLNKLGKQPIAPANWANWRPTLTLSPAMRIWKLTSRWRLFLRGCAY